MQAARAASRHELQLSRDATAQQHRLLQAAPRHCATSEAGPRQLLRLLCTRQRQLAAAAGLPSSLLRRQEEQREAADQPVLPVPLPHVDRREPRPRPWNVARLVVEVLRKEARGERWIASGRSPDRRRVCNPWHSSVRAARLVRAGSRLGVVVLREAHPLGELVGKGRSPETIGAYSARWRRPAAGASGKHTTRLGTPRPSHLVLQGPRRLVRVGELEREAAGRVPRLPAAHDALRRQRGEVAHRVPEVAVRRSPQAVDVGLVGGDLEGVGAQGAQHHAGGADAPALAPWGGWRVRIRLCRPATHGGGMHRASRVRGMRGPATHPSSGPDFRQQSPPAQPGGREWEPHAMSCCIRQYQRRRKQAFGSAPLSADLAAHLAPWGAEPRRARELERRREVARRPGGRRVRLVERPDRLGVRLQQDLVAVLLDRGEPRWQLEVRHGLPLRCRSWRRRGRGRRRGGGRGRGCRLHSRRGGGGSCRGAISAGADCWRGCCCTEAGLSSSRRRRRGSGGGGIGRRQKKEGHHHHQ